MYICIICFSVREIKKGNALGSVLKTFFLKFSENFRLSFLFTNFQRYHFKLRYV